jgi:Sulfotransferase family
MSSGPEKKREPEVAPQTGEGSHDHENRGDQADLAADSSACLAWAEYSESGVPTRVKLKRRAAGVSGQVSSRGGKTVIDFDWKDGTLVGLRIKGDFHNADVPAIPDRRVFKVRHRDNEVSLVAEAPAGQDDGAPQVLGLEKALRAIDRAVRSVDKKVDHLDRTLRQDILEIASGSVEALWRAHREPARVDAALPLVLIAQAHRSGGTLLARLFDGHPEVLAAPQELTWRGEVKESKYRWPDIDPSAEGPLRIAKRLIERILDDAREFNLFGYEKAASPNRDQHLPFQWSQWSYVETFLDAWLAKPPQNRRECLDIFMTAYFSAFLDWRGSGAPKKIITALKTRMNFIRSYPENDAFFDDYPDGLMISICRHPADWYASATRAGDKYDGPDDAMAVWRESAECALQLKERHPNHMVLVAFDRLVTDPAKSMRWMADRIGLTWDSILTVPTFNGMPVASNSSFESAVGIDASVLRRRDRLPTHVRERLEVDNLPLYRQFAEAADI